MRPEPRHSYPIEARPVDTDSRASAAYLSCACAPQRHAARLQPGHCCPAGAPLCAAKRKHGSCGLALPITADGSQLFPDCGAPPISKTTQ